MNALQRSLPDDERRTLYMIAKILTSATGEVQQGRLRMAEHLFYKGGKYIQEVPEEKNRLRFFLSNVYDRSKSLYYYRTGNSKEAIVLIRNSLRNNCILESQGFSFLLFDRISQYHNLSRIHFATGRQSEALDILADCIVFLMTDKAHLLEELNQHHIQAYDEDLITMRFSMMFQLLFDTVEKLHRGSDPGIWEVRHQPFFQSIFSAVHHLVIRSPQEKILLDWILLIQLFHQRQPDAFKTGAGLFLEQRADYCKGLPALLLRRLLEYL